MKKTINLLLIIGFLLFGFSCKKDKGTNPDDKLYLAGYSYNQANISVASYWNKGVMYTVTDQSKSSIAFDVLVNNGLIYLVGSFDGKPCYWKNGEMIDLSEGGTVLGEVGAIAFYNGKFYLGGTVKLPNLAGYKPRFWELDGTGIAKTVYTSAIVGTLNDIAIASNGDVYGVGDQGGKAVYWLNYVLKLLGNGVGTASGICFNGNQSYICGTETYPTGTYLGYWKDFVFSTYSEKSSEGSLAGIYLDKLGAPNSVGKKLVSGQPRAQYWDPEGSAKPLSNDFSSAFTGIYSDGNTYIGGQVNDIACYWKNGVLVSTNTPNSYTEALFMAQ